MTTFLDTNVVIALLNDKRKGDGPAIVSDIVYCEISIAMKDIAELDEAIVRLGLERLRCNDAALFRAGRAFKHYREINKGPKLGLLPDFLIGAVAEVSGAPLMTTNSKDFVGYFPKMGVISP
jgi:predicted nucleic acid-binding protein